MKTKINIGQLVRYCGVNGNFFIWENNMIRHETCKIKYGQIGMLVKCGYLNRPGSNVYLFGDALVPVASEYIDAFNPADIGVLYCGN